MPKPRIGRFPYLFAAPLVALTAARADPPASDAVAAVHDYLAVCRADAGQLWGHTLCGPLLLVDPVTRQAYATEPTPAAAGFAPAGELWRGALPAELGRANTAITWDGREWAMVLLPLPAERFARVSLLLHESFHRIQPEIGLAGPDALNPHLDERDGRYWLRLELRALASALRTRGAARAAATRDAVLFRRIRQARFPGAEATEDALERQEGLAEYTGVRLALAAQKLPVASAADAIAAFEARPSYVRSLGYGTGPALGLLLDDAVPGWRTRIRHDGFAAQLARAIRFVPPPDLAAAGTETAARYGGAELARTEDDRAAVRAQRLAELRARLVEGPVLRLRQTGLSTNFNPNQLVPLGADGTVYPTGKFTAAWGSLEVIDGGALVAPDMHQLRVQAPPAPVDPGRTLRGPGWTLELAAGWHLIPSPGRAGDLDAVPSTPQ